MQQLMTIRKENPQLPLLMNTELKYYLLYREELIIKVQWQWQEKITCVFDLLVFSAYIYVGGIGCVQNDPCELIGIFMKLQSYQLKYSETWLSNAWFGTDNGSDRYFQIGII